MDKLIYSELHRLISEKELRALQENLCELNEVDIAEFMDELAQEQSLVVFRMLPKDLAHDVFACLELDKQEHIINQISDRELQNIVETLYVDDMVDMLEELPANLVKRVLKNAVPSIRSIINEFLQYPENSAGSIMTSEYIGLRQHMTVEEAFAYIRKHGIEKETIYTCYVMDNKRNLEGVVTVKDMLMNPYETLIGDIMDTKLKWAVTTQDREEVADMFTRYGLLAMPVVDHENKLVGIITVDDIVDVMEEEATEDFEKMAAMLPSEKPYLKTGVLELAKNRIIWLMVLMISSMITGSILARYHEIFAVLPLLVTFIPMLTGTGGNAGSQSATMIIRGMTVGDIEIGDAFKVFLKEAGVGIIVGVILGIINFIRLIWQYPEHILICLTVVISLFFTVIISKIIGGLLPLLAKFLKLDPAILAAPIITTVVDALSLIIYFNIAVYMLAEI